MATKRLRCFLQAGTGFEIEVPADCRVTLGYFNPAAAGWTNPYAGGGSGQQTGKATALRIYRRVGKKEDQIACFLGVTSFRDLSLPYKDFSPNSE